MHENPAVMVEEALPHLENMSRILANFIPNVVIEWEKHVWKPTPMTYEDLKKVAEANTNKWPQPLNQEDLNPVIKLALIEQSTKTMEHLKQSARSLKMLEEKSK